MTSLLVILLLLVNFSAGIRWGSEKEQDSVVQSGEEKKHCEFSELSDLLRRSSPPFPHHRVLQRRQDRGSTDGSTVGFSLPFHLKNSNM